MKSPKTRSEAVPSAASIYLCEQCHGLNQTDDSHIEVPLFSANGNIICKRFATVQNLKNFIWHNSCSHLKSLSSHHVCNSRRRVINIQWNYNIVLPDIVSPSLNPHKSLNKNWPPPLIRVYGHYLQWTVT